ncbi:ABC transporter [Bifidobacterium pseudolongum subsp. pseudolongum]|uniref:ATP-binding cassette domain-containing protein n=1 Tax=Bifidobacterium pseudolongum TaxID=1694 RepID=UPI0010E77908|nr:ABC transporter ATP-binding protein [Bifidobacterium pseudolongum]RYQ49826.1 ABC transporter [Bifidobacterium pseudolongum subsp. pseudolongum]RYQ52577.1 ABC transporter [Bifidobacterium pseudolongum subsp. pseudolongum]
MTNDVITLDRITKRYADFTLDLTMHVPKDTIIALVGVNGSGKTTTFRIILGLAKPDTGNGTLLGADVTRLPNAVKRDVGAVLADTSFDAVFTGDDVIRQMKAFYPNFNVPLCRTLLERFALPTDKKMEEFSTGMTAKFKTVIAMGHEPDVLILDEPTAGLDIVARGELLDLLRAYMETPGHSILISSHNSKDPCATTSTSSTVGVSGCTRQSTVCAMSTRRSSSPTNRRRRRIGRMSSRAPVGTVSSMHSPMNAAITKRTRPASRWHVATSMNSSQS